MHLNNQKSFFYSTILFWSSSKRYALTFGLLLILTLSWWFFSFNKILARVNKLKYEIGQLKNIEEAVPKVEKEHALLNEYAKKNNISASGEGGIINSAALDLLSEQMPFLAQQATQCELDIQTCLSCHKKEDKRANLKITLHGSYPSLVCFFKSLENNSKIAIQEFEIVRKHDTLLECQLILIQK